MELLHLVIIFLEREANLNAKLTKSCEDSFNSDKTVAESDLMGQLNT